MGYEEADYLAKVKRLLKGMKIVKKKKKKLF